jgi:hypothetical protein
MKCPHVRPGQLACLACIHAALDADAARARELGAIADPASCMHGAEGHLFALGAARLGLTLEWCPGCGAYRLLPLGDWIAPSTQARQR